MTTPTPAPRGFRRGLAQSLPGWVDEGLVSPEAAETLRVRYGLDEAGGSMQRLLLLCIYMVGAALIGGGVITFVAANWTAIPQAGQAGLLIGAMLACHLAGYHIGYQRRTHPGLGHALIVIGTLVFGASIPLFSEIFEIEGHWTAGFGMWALGAAAIGAVIGSVPLALAAIVVTVIAHGGVVMEGGDPRAWVVPVLAVAGLAFAQGYQSRVTAVFTVVGVAVAMLFQGGALHDFQGVVIAALVTGLLYTSAGVLHRWPPGARTTGVLLTLFFMYLVSFEELANEVISSRTGHLTPPLPPLMFLILLAVMALGAVAAWARLFMTGKVDASPRVVTAGLFSVTILGLLGLVMAGTPGVLFLATNASLALLGAALIWAGVRTAGRGAFWTGMVVIGALIIGRFLEIDTSLLSKSLVFMGCGIAVIVAGLRFERRLRNQEGVS